MRPDLWDKGIGKSLLEPVIDTFNRWGTVHGGLFTFPQSTKHIHLYRKYGFYPRFLTAITSKSVGQPIEREAVRYSESNDRQRTEALAACRELTDSIFAGFDVTSEIVNVAKKGLGETVLIYDSARLDGFAVCHCGPGTEAGSGVCYFKFAAVRPGNDAGKRLEHLLDACEKLAIDRGLKRLAAGVNLARTGAFQTLMDRGFRVDTHGVSMARPNQPGYDRPDAYVLDDWR